MNYLILLSFLFFLSPAMAENHLVYFGGGRSANPDDADFDKGFRSLLRYSKNKNWDGDFYYRKSLPPEMTPEDSKRIKEFSPDSFLKKIEDLKADIRGGKIKAKEQLLVFIDTHGTLDDDKNVLLTTDQGLVKSEALKSLITLAEEKNIKLGVVGANCYSGSLLRFKTPNTCIITFAQADHVAYKHDSESFLSHMSVKAGATNLEDAYLISRARRTSDSYPALPANDFYPAQPMISTDAGVLVDQALAPFKNGISYSLDRERRQAEPVCRNQSLMIESLNQRLNTLIRVVDFNSKNLGFPVTYKGPGNIMDIQQVQNMQKKLLAYEELYKESEPFAKQGEAEACSKDQSCLSAKFVDAWASMQTDPKTLEQAKEMKQTPEYKKFKEAAPGQDDLYRKMYDLSIEINKAEREAYDQLYKMASKKVKGPNPCRDFKI